MKIPILTLGILIGLAGFSLMHECDKTQSFTVTAYDSGECCCGEWADGTFADGSPVGGLTVAAPRDIPFGTRIKIPGYGVATVRDRGGAITEGRLDVYFKTHQQALNWGRQDLECEILN